MEETKMEVEEEKKERLKRTMKENKRKEQKRRRRKRRKKRGEILLKSKGRVGQWKKEKKPLTSMFGLG